LINEVRLNNIFYYFRYERKVGDWTIVIENSPLSIAGVLSSGEMTDSLRIRRN